jgi:hypothetical protein
MGSPIERSHRTLLGVRELTWSMRAPGKLLMKLVRKQGHEKVPTEEFLKK